jgi:hypothetical protein
MLRDTYGVKRMTTELALLLLHDDRDHNDALKVLAENEGEAIQQAAARWFPEPQLQRAINAILYRLALTARYYDPQLQTAKEWVATYAELESRHLLLQSETNSLLRLRSKVVAGR